MKIFFSLLVALAVLGATYSWFAPLPTVRTRYRAVHRYQILHGLASHSTTNLFSEGDLAGLSKPMQQAYTDAAQDGYVMARQAALWNRASLAFSGLLAVASFCGLRFITTKRHDLVPDKPHRFHL